MASSDGSICPLSCHPATVPSGLITHTVICKPPSVTRSVPRITVIDAALAAEATSTRARSRNAESGGGAIFPGHRYPGTKHSGKQMTIAPRRPASAIADVARPTDSSGVEGTRAFASAIRTTLLVICASLLHDNHPRHRGCHLDSCERSRGDYERITRADRHARLGRRRLRACGERRAFER